MEIEACICITKAASKYMRRIEIQMQIGQQILHNTLYSCSAH